MSAKFLLSAALIGATLAGCDSVTQLTTSNKLSSAPTVNAVENLSTANGVTTIAFAFPAGSLPTSVTTGTNPRVVLGGKLAPLSAGASGSYIAALPPQTPPPTPDVNGNTVLVFQTDNNGSQLISTHLTVNRS